VSLRDEILEQPDAVARLLDAGPAAYAALGTALQARRPRFAVIAARGSSDHAGLYAQYLLAVRNRLLVALATPSTITLYGARPEMADALVVGISQSGRSPDIVAVIEEARRQGALTVAITNEPSSPLAEAAAEVIDLGAGPELATAATKTYTTQLTAVALLSGALDPLGAAEHAEIARVPELMHRALSTEAEVRQVVDRMPRSERSAVLGRGYSYATAREWALKLQELAQLPAIPFSAADFEHGPLALVEPGYPVLAVAPSGEPLDAQLGLLRRLRDELGARVLVISDSAAARELDEGLHLPEGIPGWLSPLVEILPGQWYAYHLARARGLDPDKPRAISKVTRTR